MLFTSLGLWKTELSSNFNKFGVSPKFIIKTQFLCLSLIKFTLLKLFSSKHFNNDHCVNNWCTCCGKEWVWPDSFWKTLFNALTSHNWSPILLLQDFYTHQQYYIISKICCNTITKLVHPKMFLFFNIYKTSHVMT